MEIEKTIGQDYLFEIKITFNGKLVIKNISQNLQIERTTETITAATPEKTLDKKKNQCIQLGKRCSFQNQKRNPKDKTITNSFLITFCIIAAIVFYILSGG